jgi:hypothetical protein
VSPVILLGLVVMWAVVLVPMWLRRHDEAEETRSVDKFTTAMHTLSRRESLSPEKKYVLMPHRSRSYEVHVSGASANPKRAHDSRKPLRPAISAATRRRRTLIGLLVTAGVTLALVVVVGGLLILAVQLIADACLVAFVVHLRNRAQHASVIRRSRHARAPEAPRRVQPRFEPAAGYYDDDDLEDIEEEFEPVPVRMAAGAEDVVFDQTVSPDVAPADAGFEPAADDRIFDQTAADDHVERTVVMASASAPPPRVEVEVTPPGPVADLEPDETNGIGARPWEPVPVPKPVYASKPAAPARRHRAPTFDPLLPPVDSPAELDQVDDLEEILDRRWAVND